MDDIVLKDRDGKDITYPGINSIRLKTADGGTREFLHGETAEKTVAPDFSGGDMEIPADGGTFLTKVTIEKPETLVPENVRNGVEVAGVTGEFIGDTEEVTVELALADGDQTVSPSADGKVISGVTITKPANLVPANIAKDVDIAGVTGSLEVPETVETSIELDFSAGAMEVTPESGQSFSAVNIPVPGTLIPENIAEGVDIAGIIGTLAAGGGNGNIVSKVVYVTPGSTSSFTVTHNLGVVPDMVLVHHTGTTTYKYTNFWFGMSTAAINANILLPKNAAQYYYTNGWVNKSVGIDTTDTTMPLNNATASSLTITAPHSSYGKINTSAQHVVYLIGGLT